MRYGVLSGLFLSLLVVALISVAIPSFLSESIGAFSIPGTKNDSMNNFSTYNRLAELNDKMTDIENNADKTQDNPTDGNTVDAISGLRRSAKTSALVASQSAIVTTQMTSDAVHALPMGNVGTLLVDLIPVLVLTLIFLTYFVSAYMKWRT